MQSTNCGGIAIEAGKIRTLPAVVDNTLVVMKCGSLL